jgi:hypothetical protein
MDANSRGDNKADIPQQVVCPNCLEENESFQHFCVKCGAPISSISTVGPLERTLADGFMYRQAVAGRPKLIVVIGIWMMFLPVLIVSLSLLVMILIENFGGFFRETGLAVVMSALLLVSFIILFRTTKNHFIARRKIPNETDSEVKPDDF